MPLVTNDYFSKPVVFTPAECRRLDASSIPEPMSGCYLWLGGLYGPSPYGKVTFHGRRRRAHRVEYARHKGVIPPGLHVLHKCDNPICVNPDHLFLGSNADNVADMVRKGRTCHGEDSTSAKLTVDDVHAIRRSSEPRAVLAARYGLTLTSVNAIVNRTSWAHLPAHPDDVKRTRARGSAIPLAKLTEADVVRIRSMVAEGSKVKDVARLFGIRRTTASGIVNRHSWRHVK